MEAHSEALAYELRPFGVRVVLIEPGSYATTVGESVELSRGLAEGQRAYDDAYQRMRAVDEPWPLGDPTEVAQTVVAAIEDEMTALRVLLGADADWYVHAKAKGDEEYRRRIWELWQLPS